jgi:hypothetical protein
MMTFVKWMLAGLFSALAWLVTGYTFEYFRPYRKSNR